MWGEKSGSFFFLYGSRERGELFYSSPPPFQRAGDGFGNMGCILFSFSRPYCTANSINEQGEDVLFSLLTPFEITELCEQVIPFFLLPPLWPYAFKEADENYPPSSPSPPPFPFNGTWNYGRSFPPV